MDSDLERRIRELELDVSKLKQTHGFTHEISKGDEVRPAVMNQGTLLARERAINFSTGLTASLDIPNKRINVVATGTGAGLTVEEEDGAPTIANVTKIKFDEDVGFVVTDEGSGVAHIGGSFGAGSFTPEGVSLIKADADQTIGTGSSTKVTFSAELWDEGGLGDIANDKIVIVTTGIYHVGATVAWENKTGATGRLLIEVQRVDPFAILAGSQVEPVDGTAVATIQHCSNVVSLEAGDELELYVHHQLGSDWDIDPGDVDDTQHITVLWAYRIA